MRFFVNLYSEIRYRNEKHPSSEDLDGESAKKQQTEPNEGDDDSDSPSVEQTVTPSTSTNELPYFDFSVGTVYTSFKCKHRIEDWVKQVEEIRAKQEWSESTTKHKVLGKMKTLPKVHSWFSSIADIVSWSDFKEKLVYAFPEKDDYYMDVLRMTKRKKRQNETYVEYFNAKLELLKPWNLSDKQTVSCLLGGVSNVVTNCIGRMGRYKTLGELLKYFKSCDDKEKIKFSKNNEKKAKPLDVNEINEKSSHSSPELIKKNLVVVLENKRLDVNNLAKEEKLGEEITNKPDEANQKCSCCDRNGHSSTNCPLIKGNKIPQVALTHRTDKVTADHTRQNSNLIVVHENKLIASGSDVKTNQSIHDADKQDSKTSLVKCETHIERQPPQKPNETGQVQKCASCDKPGHSIVNCPLVKSQLQARQLQKPVTSPESGRQTDKAIVNRDMAAKNKNEASGNDQSGKKCSYCDNKGHSSLVCPLIEAEDSNPRKSNIKIVLDKDRLSRVRLPSSNVDEASKDDLICESKERPAQKKTEGNDNQKKCLCCDKSGHTSLNCPLVGVSKNAPGKSSAARPSSNAGTAQTPQKCSKCNKFGHSSLNCLIKTERDDKVAPRTKHETQTIQKCTCCDKFGHSSANCPLIGVNKNVTFKEEPTQMQANRKCLCCNKTGHASLDCPLLGSNRDDWLKQNSDKIVRYEPTSIGNSSQVRSSMPAEQKCSCCNKSDHATPNCPFYSFFNKSNAGSAANTSNLFQEAKEKLQKTRSIVDNIEQPPQKKPRGDSTEQKCYFCNKPGHVSTDCFRARFEQKHSQPLAKPPATEEKLLGDDVAKSGAQETLPPRKAQGSVLQCEFCGRVGHRLSECFFARFDRKIYEAHSSASSSSRQCLYCGKFGHQQPDCPKNKPALRRMGFRPSHPGPSRN